MGEQMTVLDGVYRYGADGAPAFVEAGALADEALHALLPTICCRPSSPGS